MSYCRPVPLGFRWPGFPRSDRSATQPSVDQSRTSAHIATPTVGTSRAAEMPTKTGEYSFYIADDGPGTVSFAWPGRSYETAISKVTTSQVPGKDELQVNLFGRAYLSSGAGDWLRADRARTNRKWQDVGLDKWSLKNSTPSKLDFAITGALTVDGQTNTLVLGQGFDSIPRYNWWVGGSNTQAGWSLHSGFLNAPSGWDIGVTVGSQMTYSKLCEHRRVPTRT